MFDLYQTITDQIVGMLEKGVAPWRSQINGAGAAGMPKNIASGKAYRGVNTFMLAIQAQIKGYDSAFWGTYKQIQEMGGQVRKGEKSTMVVFWKQWQIQDQATGEDKKIPLLRYYNVFNLSQCDGIKAPDAATFTPSPFTPIEQAASIVAGYADGPEVKCGGTIAFYRPSDDSVTMPAPERFETSESYYAVLFHELSHSTGHASRLHREMKSLGLDSEKYGKEELVAEMSAAFLCAECGITPATIDNTASYLAGWIKVLKGDKKLVIQAAGAAQKAADWIKGQRGAAAVHEETAIAA